MESSMSLHPTMAAALAPFAPAGSEVHKIAEQAIPGLEAVDATHEDFVDSMAGDLELAPIEPAEFSKKLIRAGFATHPSRRSSDRADAAPNDWPVSRAETDNAHRNEVNGTTTDATGFRS